MNFADPVNQFLAVSTIFAQALILLLVALIFTKKPPALYAFFTKNAFRFAFLTALLATVGSLLYSNIIGYAPCSLCWWQRIFLFPQVVLLGMALIKKDYRIADYAIVLSITGAIISAYQYLLSLGAVPALPCSAAGSASCAQRFVLEFGYITIPLMALTAFALIIILLLLHKRNSSYPR